MNTDLILKADLLDILFEKRNKDYGAYPLRKGYNKRMYTSMGIAFLIIAMLASLSFLKKSELISAYIETTECELGKVFEAPREETRPEPPPTPKSPVVKASLVSPDQNPVVIDNGEGRIVFDNNAPKINSPGITGPDFPAAVDPSTGGGSNIPQGPASATTDIPVLDKTIPVGTADEMPSFPGGLDALKKFLERNLSQPRDLDPGEEITVKIKFIVGYDGSLRGFEVVEDGGDAFNKEVIRVLKKMPSWIPGKAHGENVSVYYIAPVKFTPQD